MRFVLVLYLALSVHLAWAAETVLVLGDSISAAHGIPYDRGWVNLLQKKLDANGYAHQLINASVSGETTAGGRQRLPQLLKQHQPVVIMIELGGNDGLRGLSLKQARDNLTAMVRVAKGQGVKVLLLGMRLPPNYGPRYSNGFAKLFVDLSAAEDVALVPFLLEGFATDLTMMQDDGIHPREAAQPLIVEHVWGALELLLK